MSQKFVVIEDYPSEMKGVCTQLKEKYLDAEILTADVASGVEAMVQSFQPDLIIMDLSIPFDTESSSKLSTGLDLLKDLLGKHSRTNLAIRSGAPENLIQIKRHIQDHDAGFVVIHKTAEEKEMLDKIDWALNGRYSTTREMRSGPEMRDEWMTLLQLACKESLTDEAIAQKMNLSIRTVRGYWSKVQDALEIYPKEGVNLRVKTYNVVREFGLLD